MKDKIKRLIGHNSILDLCSYSFSKKIPFKKSLENLKRNSKEDTRKTILWYGGRLSTNGMTTSLLNWIQFLGDEEYRHIIYVLSDNEEALYKKEKLFSKQVSLVSFPGVMPTLSEVCARASYFLRPKDRAKIWQKLERMYERNAQHLLDCLNPDVVIQFTGYDRDAIGLFAKAKAKKLIFAHNDKIAETSQGGSEDGIFLNHFLRCYDVVIPVTSDIAKGLLSFGIKQEQIQVVSNLHDDEKVKRRSQEAIFFGAETKSDLSIQQLEALLSSKQEVFVTIGRFVAQKGHALLLTAFSEYVKQYPETTLILIGGYGNLYEKTRALAKSLSIEEKVVFIQQMENPMPILKRCQLFLLSSLFEGQGLVLFEAASLQIPLFSTDVNGPHGFMTEYHGYLVPPTKDGILQGMRDYKAGKVSSLSIDFASYNQECLARLKGLLC